MKGILRHIIAFITGSAVVGTGILWLAEVIDPTAKFHEALAMGFEFALTVATIFSTLFGLGYGVLLGTWCLLLKKKIKHASWRSSLIAGTFFITIAYLLSNVLEQLQIPRYEVWVMTFCSVLMAFLSWAVTREKSVSPL